MERKQKTIYQLDTPYTEVRWPLISPIDQENIFEILISFYPPTVDPDGLPQMLFATSTVPMESRASFDYSSRLLAPIGRHRAAWTSPSKGKRNKKRKRQEVKGEDSNTGLNESEAPPPAPEISSHLLVGLASITRYLESISTNKAADESLEKPVASGSVMSFMGGNDLEHDGMIKVRHLAAVFVCRSSQPSVLHAHLPHLVATASLRYSHLQPTRLVQLPSGSENRLSSALGLPRASFVAILKDAPHSKPLLDLVQELVPVIEVPWLEEARKAQYMPVKINTVLTTAPLGKVK